MIVSVNPFLNGFSNLNHKKKLPKSLPNFYICLNRDL